MVPPSTTIGDLCCIQGMAFNLFPQFPFIDVGKSRIWGSGGQGLDYWGGGQIPSRHMMS